MRRIAVAVILVLLLAGVFVGRASADPRCCHGKKPPVTGGGPGLPATGVPLYLPVLLSLGLIGTGVVIRRRTREDF